jgi:MoaA/NifB/PqqE/SkfB family radical SAM enzyme
MANVAARLRRRYREIAATGPRLKGWRAYANWALANASMALRTTRLAARPLKLTFDPITACQLRCPLCPTGLGIQDRGPGRASLHLFEHLMEEVGDYVFFLDFYNWGEPLLNRDLEAMLRLASRKRIVSNVSSNLSLPLDDDRLRSLLGSGLSELIVSIDGTSQETYGTYRRSGNFELAFGNLRRILALKREMGLSGPVVTWRFYVFRFNEHEMGRARELAAEIGVDRLVFGTPFLDEGRFPIPAADREAMRQWASTDPAFDRYRPGHSEYLDPAAKGPVRKRCDWHYVSTAINPDGGVAPCCAVFEKGNDFGTLGGDGTYMELVNNAAFTSVRARFAGRRAEPTGLVCERCPTPSIMDYGSIMNRHIALYTLAALAGTARRAFSAASRIPDMAPR